MLIAEAFYNPQAIPLAMVLAFAVSMYPLGFMLGSSCSPCCERNCINSLSGIGGMRVTISGSTLGFGAQGESQCGQCESMNGTYTLGTIGAYGGVVGWPTNTTCGFSWGGYNCHVKDGRFTNRLRMEIMFMYEDSKLYAELKIYQSGEYIAFPISRASIYMKSTEITDMDTFSFSGHSSLGGEGYNGPQSCYASISFEAIRGQAFQDTTPDIRGINEYNLNNITQRTLVTTGFSCDFMNQTYTQDILQHIAVPTNQNCGPFGAYSSSACGSIGLATNQYFEGQCMAGEMGIDTPVFISILNPRTLENPAWYVNEFSIRHFFIQPWGRSKPCLMFPNTWDTTPFKIGEENFGGDESYIQPFGRPLGKPFFCEPIGYEPRLTADNIFVSRPWYGYGAITYS
jgi:hypothetical protein